MVTIQPSVLIHRYMRMKKHSIFSLLLTMLLLIGQPLLSACSGGSSLNPSDPVTLTFWHVYGEQVGSPMNLLVQQFNETIGMKKGIVINVTRMSNASEIGEQLLAAQEGKPGAGTMPDLFLCYPGTASLLGPENLVDWSDFFSPEELDSYVDAFVDEGILQNRLCVFPVCKSTRLLYVNGTEFERFQEDTGITYSSLRTWDGFFRTAAKYREWSKGKPFCAFDYLVQNVDLTAREMGGTQIIKNGCYDCSDPVLRSSWKLFADALIRGDIIVSDLYANTQMMTGEVPAGTGSSAAILYFNDIVTYSDNTTEPMNLKVLPLPVSDRPEAASAPLAPQTGCGICALKTDSLKAEAASVFVHWLTESERNLDFAAKTGYFPVTEEAFQAIDSYRFQSPSYRSVYNAIRVVKNTCHFVPLPSDSGFIEKTNHLYDTLRSMQTSLNKRYLDGEDPDTLELETWEQFCSCLGHPEN